MKIVYYLRIHTKKPYKGVKELATIREIAKRVGVSPATVSGVLSNNPKLSVSDETRNRIIHVAKNMNYKKKVSKPLMTKIAFLYWITEITELEDVYFKTMRLAVENQVVKQQIELVRVTPEEGIEAVPADIEGAIAIGAFTRSELDHLQKLTPNVVFIDTSPNDDVFDSVLPDVEKFTRKIIQFFVNEGHAKIGMLGMYDVDKDSGIFKKDPREKAFRQEMEERGMLNEAYIFIRKNAALKEGYNGMLEAIEQLGDDLPTAFFIATDALAIGALQALNERDVKVPNRVSVFSINNIQIASYVSPPLTTYHICGEELVNIAFEVLNEKMASGREMPLKVLMSSHPVFRKSTLLQDGI